MTKETSPRGKNLKSSNQKILADNLWLKILIGMFLGLVAGFILSPEGLSVLPQEIAFSLGEWIRLPGVIFLGLIQMVIIPLIACSIILGIADSGDTKKIKQLGIRLVPYFLLTTTIAISIGLFLAYLIKPGLAIDSSLIDTLSASTADTAKNQRTFSELTIPQRIANIIPSNPAKAELERNMLQIVIASILVGFALLASPKTGKAFKDLCIAGQTLSMKIISWAMQLAPYAVFGLLCYVTIRIGLSAIFSVGLYVAAVLSGLILMLMAYLLLVRFISGRSPRDFLKAIREAQIIAFSTSSSAATMPISIQNAEEKLKIKPEISRFVIPLGATINMDGTALYQAVAAVFLCQAFGVDLSLGETILLLLTTLGASIDTPATPGVGIIVLATILASIGVPAEGIGLIIGVDRILDMCRTTINVTGDLTASTIMQTLLEKKELKDKAPQ